MKAQKLEVIKEFFNKKVGQIIDIPRHDVAVSLVEQGYCRYKIVEVEKEPLGNQVIGKVSIFTPNTVENDNNNSERSEQDSISAGSGTSDKKRRGRKSGKSKTATE